MIYIRYIMRNDLEHGVKAILRDCHNDIKPKSMSPAIKTEIPAETIKLKKDPLTKENQNQNSWSVAAFFMGNAIDNPRENLAHPRICRKIIWYNYPTVWA